jgi:ABC-type transport system involved in multi-copper enzyme maturation permease subunit
MTAITLTRPEATTIDHRPIFSDVLRSEWTKLRGVRSTYWTLLAAVVAMVGISALICSIYVSRYSTLSVADKLQFNPTSFSLNGVLLGQLAIGVLGVLVIASEFSTGAIRSTFAAVPQRRTVLAAKATVFTAVTLVVGLVSSFAAFFVGQAILSSKGIQANIGDPGVLRAVAGTGVYLAVLGLFALGIGALIRHSAGAIAALFGMILVLPGLVAALPASWSSSISKYLPSNAGQAIMRTIHHGAAGGRGGPSLTPWVGLGVFCLYAAVALGFAAFVVSRRDA